MKRSQGLQLSKMALNYVTGNTDGNTILKRDLYLAASKDAQLIERKQLAKKKGFGSWEAYEKFKTTKFMRMIKND